MSVREIGQGRRRHKSEEKWETIVDLGMRLWSQVAIKKLKQPVFDDHIGIVLSAVVVRALPLEEVQSPPHAKELCIRGGI